MTMIAIENAPATRREADASGISETPEYMTGFIETIRSGDCAWRATRPGPP
jgi:hypothetical protein